MTVLDLTIVCIETAENANNGGHIREMFRIESEVYEYCLFSKNVESFSMLHCITLPHSGGSPNLLKSFFN